MRVKLLLAGALTLLCPLTSLSADTADREASRALRRTPVVEVFEKSRDAVVNISALEVIYVDSGRRGDDFRSSFDEDEPRRRVQQKYRSGGSGFVVHEAGYIVTNAHVVANTVDREVIFADGRRFDARIVAADRTRDVAILKIEAPSPLPTLPLGRSDDIMIGETVIAIGNPLGYQNTVTAGVVSAVGRRLAISDDLVFQDLIQTDASINPGNSGGPLLNVLGELIGVNCAVADHAQNISFAIPVDHLRRMLPELLDIERRNHIDIGLMLDTLQEPRIVDVRAGSAAARAGLQPGDRLLSIDGVPVDDPFDFPFGLLPHRAGDEIALDLERDGAPVEATLVLAPRIIDPRELALKRLGVEIEPLPPALASDLEVAGGVLVAAVEDGGPADLAGLEPRDVIMSVNRTTLGSLDDLAGALDAAQGGTVIPVRFTYLDGNEVVRRARSIRIR